MTSQLSRFGRETHDFLTDLTTAYQSHDFSRYSRNIISVLNTIQMSRDPHVTCSWVLDRKVSNYEAARDDKF